MVNKVVMIMNITDAVSQSYTALFICLLNQQAGKFDTTYVAERYTELSAVFDNRVTTQQGLQLCSNTNTEYTRTCTCTTMAGADRRL